MSYRKESGRIISRHCREKDAEAIVLLSEASYAIIPKHEDPHAGSVHENPRRRSCILAMCMGPEVGDMTYMLPFARNFTGHLVAGEAKWMEEGKMENYLVPKWWAPVEEGDSTNQSIYDLGDVYDDDPEEPNDDE